jgi:hypothetical protein
MLIFRGKRACALAEEKQHPPVKNRFFRLDAPLFSISIRSASECSFSLDGPSNF